MSSTIRPLLLAFFLTVMLLLSSGRGYAQTVDDWLAKGDICDQKFDAQGALKCYCQAEKLEPKNVTVLVRSSRAYRYLMADASSKEEKLRLGRIALRYAELAAATGPQNPDAQLAIAITYGKMMPYLGSKEQVEASPRVKASVDKTLQLDPKDDTAWHILGRWNRVLADVNGLKRALAGVIYGGLPKGSNEKAEQCLTKAVALNPNRLMHYIELGRVYAQMGRKDDARRCLKKGLSMPDTEKDDPETKARGREQLAKL